MQSGGNAPQWLFQSRMAHPVWDRRKEPPLRDLFGILRDVCDDSAHAPREVPNWRLAGRFRLFPPRMPFKTVMPGLNLGGKLLFLLGQGCGSVVKFTGRNCSAAPRNGSTVSIIRAN